MMLWARADGETQYEQVQIGHKEEIFYYEGRETLEQVARRSCGCHIIGIVQGQVEQGFEQPDIVDDDPAHGREGWTRLFLKVLPTQSIL